MVQELEDERDMTEEFYTVDEWNRANKVVMEEPLCAC